MKIDRKHSIDHPSLIRMCLNCKKPKCNNCIRYFPMEKLMRLQKGGDTR